jgi:hypothetical protein
VDGIVKEGVSAEHETEEEIVEFKRILMEMRDSDQGDRLTEF